MKTVVITRFSLNYGTNFNTTENKKKRESWFKFRSDLYINGPFQSLINNSKQPNKVMLFFEDGDQTLVDKYLKFAISTSLTSIDFVFLFSSLENQIDDLYQELRNFHGMPIIISRLDSDDLIPNNYFQKLEEFNKKECDIHLIAAKGFATDFNKIAEFYHDKSPFLNTYLENLSRSSIEFHFINHTKVKNFNHFVMEELEYCQIIHKTNISNSIPPFYYPFLNRLILPLRILSRRGQNYKIHFKSIKKFKSEYLNGFGLEDNQISKLMKTIREFNTLDCAD